MNVLVTGGAGFVGSHLAEELVKLNHQVTIYDNLSTGKIENLNLDLYSKLKIRDINHLINEDKIEKFDVVFHLAAKPFSKAKNNWFTESNSIFQTNVVGTYNLLKFINPNCHFIFTSSASVYGSGTELEERSPFNLQSAYGYSKTLAEHVIINSPRKYTILRPGTIIGPRGRCFPNRVVWSLINNKECLFFKNGEVLRDIIDVHDIVSALITVMKSKKIGIFNLASNSVISGKQLCSTVTKLAKKKGLSFKGVFSPIIPFDFVLESTLNSDKFYQTFEWLPKYNLSKSLSEIFNYYKLNPKKEPPSWESL